MNHLLTFVFLNLLLFQASAQVPDSTFGEPNSLESTTGLEFQGITAFMIESADDVVQGAIHTTQGNIILGGYTIKDDSLDFLMARLLPNGRYDTALGPMGRKVLDIGYVNDSCTLIANYDDSRFLMGGCAYLPGQQGYVGILARLDFDGVPDPVFGDDGHIVLDLPSEHEMITEAIALPDGKILIAGNAFIGGTKWYWSDSTHHFLARLMPDGQLDSTFAENGILYHTPQNYGGCLAPIVADIGLAPDGSIVIAGVSYDPYQGELGYEHPYCPKNDMYVFKCTSEGALDSSFGNNGAVILPADEGVPYDIEVREDGKIVVAGGVTYGGLYTWPINVYLTRLLPGGEVDMTFRNTGYYNKLVYLSWDSVDPEGTIQIGDYTYIPLDEIGGAFFGLMRMDESGQVDSSFVQSEFVGAQGNGVVFSSYEWLPIVSEIVQAYAVDSTSIYFIGRVGSSGGPYNTNMFIAKVKLPPPAPVSTVAVPWRPLSFSVYPNPVTDGIINLSPATEAVLGPLSLRLLDMQGRAVWQQKAEGLDNAFSIDVSGLNSGVYILEVAGEAGRWVEKVVVR